ncbi:MAG: substrate-binding domain-containing protein [Synergistaceae bacterium]|jgi:ribose transport system substrate-binding protein|nr:substrate-binding domain-containing protein [Synergistaceae bacterium]
MRKKLVIAAMVMFAAALLLAWSGAASAAVVSGVGKDSDVYYMITFSSGIDYWKGCFEGFEKAAEIYGAKAEYTGGNLYDVNQEVTVFEQVVSQKPAGIAVTCINPDAFKEPIQKAIDAGIPVVTFDADSPDSGRYSYLGTENYNAGVAAGNAMAELCGAKGEIGILQAPGQLNLQQRVDGFRDTLTAKYPDMKIVQIVNGNMDQSEGAKVTASMLQANPNIVGIFATDDTSGVGAAIAVKESGKVSSVNIVSFDTAPGTLDLIKEGTIKASIAQGVYNMGFWSFEFLFNVQNGLANPKDGWREKKIAPLPGIVDTGVSVVTASNVDSFYMQQ